jgi:hypothetical protein
MQPACRRSKVMRESQSRCERLAEQITDLCGIGHGFPIRKSRTPIITPTEMLQLLVIFSYKIRKRFFFFPLWPFGPQEARVYSFLRFPYHTQRCTTVGRTPLDEWLAHSRDLYLTTHNTHNRQISVLPTEFELTIPVLSEQPQTHPIDRADTGTDMRATPHWKLRSV